MTKINDDDDMTSNDDDNNYDDYDEDDDRLLQWRLKGETIDSAILENKKIHGDIFVMGEWGSNSQCPRPTKIPNEVFIP